jgi:hypothetical protein
MTTNAARRATLLALAFASFALPASLQAQESGPGRGVPPSVGQEIDRALSQVPGGVPSQTPGAGSLGQEVDRLIGGARPTVPGAGSMRQPVAVAFVNKTTFKALVVQFAPEGATEWGANRLRNERMNPGATMRWRMNDGNCRYDVRITFDAGNEFVRLGHDFCAQEKIEITAIDAQPESLPVREPVALYRVINQSEQMVAALRVTPVGARRPGEDLLGQWVMDQGDRYTGRVARSGSCLYDIRVGYSVDERQTSTLARQNLCEKSEIIIPRRTGTRG